MAHSSETGYFYSIEPFWDMEEMSDQILGLSGEISVNTFYWKQGHLLCVPGNGQVGIMLQGPEDFSGYCYGALDSYGETPLYGMRHVSMIRFSPGTFSKVCGISAKLIDPYGVPLEDIFSSRQISQMKDAMASSAPGLALMNLFGGWAENARCTEPAQEQQIAKQVTQLIWEKRGQIRVRELEEETTYSTRYLQDVVGRQVGIAPKQMCRQIRFQNALRLLNTGQQLNLCRAAQTLGYSDQAHLCREFKQFSGLSPTEYQKQIGR